MLNVLIACEESQSECLAFLNHGCNAFSCDLKKSSGGRPDRHIVGDCVPLCKSSDISFVTEDGQRHSVSSWDLIIAHPPCTYLAKSGACNYYPKAVDGCSVTFNYERYQCGLAARDFFLFFLTLDVPFVVVENPVPMSLFELPPFDFSVEPYFFGEPYTKHTLYWCGGFFSVPPLLGTDFVRPTVSWCALKRDSVQRSKSFTGISNAMAEQWVPYIEFWKSVLGGDLV